MDHGVTDEQRRRLQGCKTAEDLASLAREEGHELSDDELEAMAGGEWNDRCSKVNDSSF